MTEPTLAENLERFDQQGWLHLPGALTPQETERCRVALNMARANGWEEGLNHVGNMWFDCLLERMPDIFGPLVGHRSVAPYLKALYGRQCQLRSLRGHINPGPYDQEWHLDFYGYWQQDDAAPYASRATGINTTFYFQDNGPGIARLTYVKNGHRVAPPAELTHRGGWPVSEATFNAWYDAQEHEVVYPKAGDCLLFFSHIPHKGSKDDDSVERSNVVCHYQNTPFYGGIPHVSALQTHTAFPID
jgi:hypothetical protein